MRRIGRIALRVGVSGALIVAVLMLTDGAATLSRLAGVDPVWLIVAAVLLNVQTILMAVRWRLVAARLGLAISRRVAIGEYYLSQVVNMTLPGGVVGDVARAARTRAKAGLTPAAQAIMIERLAGQIAMFVLATAGFVVALAVPGGIDWPKPVPVFVGTALFLASVLGVLTSTLSRSDRTGATADFARAIRFALLASEVRREQVLLGLAIATLNLAAFAAAAHATGTTLSIEACATLIPLILTAMLIPFAIGGWGWREGAAAALFPLAGADSASGVAAGIAFGLVMLVASLPGVLWPILAGRALPEVRTQPRFTRKPVK